MRNESPINFGDRQLPSWLVMINDWLMRLQVKSCKLAIPSASCCHNNHSISFHVFPVLMARIVGPDTPNSRAISLTYIRSSASMALICFTWACVSLAEPCFSPRRFLPFSLMSLAFSAAVPRNRCAGFTHALTSHVWHTSMSGGISHLNNFHATRCALCSFPSKHAMPYPSGRIIPCHSQQPVPRCRHTLARNLSRTVSFISGRPFSAECRNMNISDFRIAWNDWPVRPSACRWR